jgi:uncharacterized protein YegP (UPF0339 family)
MSVRQRALGRRFELMAEQKLYKRPDGRWGWRLKADNGRIIATDGTQGYENESDARSMRDRVVGGEFKNAKKTTG